MKECVFVSKRGVQEIGFSAKEEDRSVVTLNVDGMTCSACVNTVESSLLSCVGVTKATVNLLTAKVASFALFFYSHFFFRQRLNMLRGALVSET